MPRMRYGVTALIRAAFYGHRDVVQVLLAKGADVNAKEYHRPNRVDGGDGRRTRRCQSLIGAGRRQTMTASG